MKQFIVLLYIIFISKVLLKLPDEKRKNLLSKLTKIVSLENINQLEKDFYSNDFKDTKIEYDPQKIKKLMDEYQFPQEYNFLEDINATIRVKNQENCGCCWAHASSSALGYRYQKLGKNIDLSPQYSLSCYIRDCDAGNYLIDPQLNLVKNGTVTEECLPFSSQKGTNIEKCPEKCKDGTDIKKYYSRNAYMTQDYYSAETFYDIILIIMDQLITNGPVVSSITAYQDFMELHFDPKCPNEVYSYDGTSANLGGHAVTIVGYGLLNGKYYWLIQNSWGEEACDKGFVKVEFGQIGVEKVAFSEPYIPDEEATPQEIPVKFDYIDESCYLNVFSNLSYDNWINTLDINFKNEKTSKDFNFQCSSTSFFGQSNKLKCYFEIKNYFGDLGKFVFNGSDSLGRENIFNLDDSFNGKSFYYWGINEIMTYWEFYQYYFVSGKGSKIMFKYISYGNEGEFLNPLYPNSETNKALSDCHTIELNLESWVYCNLKEEEINYFEDFAAEDATKNPMVYNALCGNKQNTYTRVYKLNKNYFPVFKVDSLIIPNKIKITKNDKLLITAQIEGSTTYFQGSELLVAFVDVEKNGANFSIALFCTNEVPTSKVKPHNIECIPNLKDGASLQFDNIYLLPYYIPYNIKYVYEIFIKDTIKGKVDSDPYVPVEPDFSYFLRMQLSLFIMILFLF